MRVTLFSAKISKKWKFSDFRYFKWIHLWWWIFTIFYRELDWLWTDGVCIFFFGRMQGMPRAKYFAHAKSGRMYENINI